MARQNPPVLLMLERLCSARKHPLSSVSGRQRYNTLDLASKIVCHETAGFIGFFLPRQLCRLWNPRCVLILGQHRTMGTAGFGGSFAPIVQYEKWEIHPVFPHFSYFRLCQNLSPNLLAPLCGAALVFHKTAKYRFMRPLPSGQRHCR